MTTTPETPAIASKHPATRDGAAKPRRSRERELTMTTKAVSGGCGSIEVGWRIVSAG